ncbi:MAG: RNA polymerase sigma factor [Tepidisphaeraceae bacterium]
MDDGPTNIPGITDEQLLAAYLSGDAAAFTELVRRYERDLYVFLNRFLGNAAAAEDVFQETFIQVHQSAKTFDPTKKFRPWLFTIGANKARDFLRSRARRYTVPLQAAMSHNDPNGQPFMDVLESPDIGPILQAENSEEAERVRQAVQRLPDSLREVLLLAYFHQFPYRQIAEMLEMPLGTVKSRLHTAVETFGQIWKSLNRQQTVS